MLKQLDRPAKHGWLVAAHSLSGRLLLLTLLFVMLSVALIYFHRLRAITKNCSPTASILQGCHPALHRSARRAASEELKTEL